MKRAGLFALSISGLLLSGCNREMNALIDNSADVVRVSMVVSLAEEEKTTEDPEEIRMLVDYVNSLDRLETSEDVAASVGMAYHINFFYTDERSEEYIHLGNQFLKTPENKWYEIPYEQAEELEAIYTNIDNP